LPAVKALALASVPLAGVFDNTPTPSGSVDDPFSVAPEIFALAGTSDEFADPVGSRALPVLTIGLARPFASDANVVVAGVLGVETVVPPAVTVTVPFPSGGLFDADVPDPPVLVEPVEPFPEEPDPDEPEEPDPPPPDGEDAPTPPLPAPTLSPPPSLLQAERRSAQLATPIASTEGSFMCVSTARNPFAGKTS